MQQVSPINLFMHGSDKMYQTKVKASVTKLWKYQQRKRNRINVMCMIGLPQNLILPSFMHKLDCYLLSGIYITYVWKPVEGCQWINLLLLCCWAQWYRFHPIRVNKILFNALSRTHKSNLTVSVAEYKPGFHRIIPLFTTNESHDILPTKKLYLI